MAIVRDLYRKVFHGLPRRTPPVAAVLTAEQRASWERDGFLVLPGIMSPEEVATVKRVVDEEWKNRAGNDHEVDMLTGPYAGRAYKMEQIPEDARRDAYKLNNLFARRAEIRRVALSPRLRPVVAELLGGAPLICNSLNFERGSQQEFHIDTWYMPPPVDNRMVAGWFALDDVDATNGPLVYYRGSHLIPAHRFSDGRLNEIREERKECDAYLQREIAARGLEQVEFHGKAGDVFIWHAQLLHAGRPIRDMTRTRSSLVVHYWRECDIPQGQVRVDPAAGSYLGHTLRGEIQY
ncbi:MAG TPA: phytanoyl-CoA dioxygenase family protein [Usitatibacter sp.]|nr:phytanoyl-CoA dioxygenase family protein [Usitatibacter sp.]